MDWKDIAGKVSEWAPAIGAALAPVTGGTSALIGGAVGALTKALGVSPDAKPEEVLAAITTDPEARLKAQIAENEFLLKQREQDVKELEIRLADLSNARQRQTEHEKITGKADKNLYALAWLGVLGYLALIIYLISFGLPKMTVELALMVGNLIGIVGAKYSGIFDYFFGSSKGSADKAAQLAGMMEKRPDGRV